MKKGAIYVSLFFLILFCEMSIFAKAAPSYIEVEEEDIYYWEISFNSDAYNSWINDGGESTIFHTSQAWTWYNYVGFKYELDVISSEQYFDSYDAWGVSIDYKGYYTEEKIEENNWDLRGSGEFKLFSASDIDSNNVGYVYWWHMPSFSPTNCMWSTISSNLADFLETNYGDILLVLDNSNSDGLWLNIDYSGIENNLRITMFFNDKGVLSSYYAEYESKEIISLQLTDGPNEDETNKDDGDNLSDLLNNIPGYPIQLFLGITLLGIITFYIRKYRVNRSR